MDRFSPPGSDFVNISAGLSLVLTYAVRHSSFAVPSRTKWKAIEEDFFFNVECGMVVFARTDLLLPKINVGSLTGMPIIRSLYLRPLTYSQHCFMATNSDPKELVSRDVWCFENQYIGAELRKTMKPVRDHLVTVSPA